MEKATETLLEKYKISSIKAVYDIEWLENIGAKVIEKNKHCMIIKIAYPFGYVGRIVWMELQRLLIEKKTPYLINLNLSGNKLTSLPSEIGQLANLSNIDLSNNQLTSLPVEIGRLVNLTKLNLSGNRLTSLPVEIGHLVNLTNLNLSNNRLTSLPVEISQLVNLTSLDLVLNELTTLPAEIGHLTNLTYLYPAGNKLTSLPAEISKLANLTSLDLSGNKLADLPAEISQLTNLTNLYLAGNKITILPTEIEKLSNLTEFGLSKNHLSSLPAKIEKLINLTNLNLSYNKLTVLPAEIGQLANLTILNLYKNQLISLPLEIGQLSNLTKLDLRDNRLTILPIEIGQLSNLTELDLRDNRLTILPVEICELTNLTVLNLYNNLLTNLPAKIGQLTNLTMLDLSNNQLNHLPSQIIQLSNLIKLCLFKNKLTDLPVGIQNLKALTHLDLEANPLDFPPEILRKVAEPLVILEYFAKVRSGKKKPLGETKVLVVGQGSVGKTSLVKRLISKAFALQEGKTDGIAIVHWQVKNQSGIESDPSEIAINVWDFGGQEIMHATHQFFLTKRSLYVLVLDACRTQQENRVEYWLKIIQFFGGEAPVLLVGNKIDQHSFDIDRTGLRKKYYNIVDILETSAKSGMGIESLETAITKEVNSLPHVRDPFPENWFIVKTELQELGRKHNFITHDKYLELCGNNDVSDEISQRTLIRFLHDLGVVLHFQDDPYLEALGILNPEWVTNGVYKILNDEALFHNKGELTIDMLNTILQIDGYPRDKRLFIINIMKKFELCYDLEPDLPTKDEPTLDTNSLLILRHIYPVPPPNIIYTFLIPDLLPKDEPILNFDGIPAFEYAYAVLPSSVITRFIVRMNRKVFGGLMWRMGIMLKIGENRVLVKADLEDGKITIAISDTEYTRRDALTAIRYQLDEIHSSIQGLNPERLVPVPGMHHAKPLSYNYLLMLEAKGIEFLPVQDGNRLVEINVRQMLSGVENEAQRQVSASKIIHNYGTYIDGHVNTSGDFAGHSKNMSASDHSVLIGRDSAGVVNTGNHNKIEDANIPAELKKSLQQLTEAIENMTKLLTDEQSIKIIKDLGNLVDEAAEPEPDKRWCSIIIERLIKTAENLDRLGDPVIRLSQKVLTLLVER